MCIYIYVYGQHDDVERFFDEVLFPDIGNLRDNERFRITENNLKYIERNKTTHAVERRLRGYSPTIRYKNRPGLWEQYFVDRENVESKKYGVDFKKVKDVQIKVHLRSDDPSEIKLIYDEIIEPKGAIFTIENDTETYLNYRGYSSRFLGGHFTEKVKKIH